MIKITNFYCEDVAVEDNSKDYVVIEITTKTYLYLKAQISRLETITEGNENYKDWNQSSKIALRLLRKSEERAKTKWFSKKKGSK